MHQITLGIRMLRRQGLYGLMAIMGLTIGLAVAILALIHSWGELNYDAHVPNSDRLALIDARVENPGRTPTDRPTMPTGFADAAKALPQVEDSTRVWRQYSSLRLDDRLDFNEIVANADPNFSALFGLTFVAGSDSALTSASEVMVSETMATRLYPSESALGKSLEIDGRYV